MFLIYKITVSSLIKLKIFLVFVENSLFQGIQSFGNCKFPRNTIIWKFQMLIMCQLLKKKTAVILLARGSLP